MAIVSWPQTPWRTSPYVYRLTTTRCSGRHADVKFSTARFSKSTQRETKFQSEVPLFSGIPRKIRVVGSLQAVQKQRDPSSCFDRTPTCDWTDTETGTGTSVARVNTIPGMYVPAGDATHYDSADLRMPARCYAQTCSGWTPDNNELSPRGRRDDMPPPMAVRPRTGPQYAHC